MAKVIVKEAGPLTTIQDEGRYGYQKYGMPTAGAMDQFSYQVSNYLVGNNTEEAVIEFTFKGPTLEFTEDTIIAITGANAAPELNGLPVPMWRTIYVNRGSMLTFNNLKKGFRGYISFKGGIDVEKIMGSKSTYLRGELGGLKGRKLQIGDEIPLYAGVDKKEYKELFFPKKYIPNFSKETLRVILGPQKEKFTHKGISGFLGSKYKITGQADRMGYRLKGSKIEHKGSADIISDGIPRGAVQVPGHGQPIIMLADRQTTGGYAKIAVVVSVDIDLIAQKKPGDEVKFKEIDLKSAHKLMKKRNEILQNVKLENRNLTAPKYYQINIDNQDFNVKIEEVK